MREFVTKILATIGACTLVCCIAAVVSAYGQAPTPPITKPVAPVVQAAPEVSTIELSKDEQTQALSVSNLVLRAQLSHNNLLDALRKSHKCPDCSLDLDRLVLIKVQEKK